jgi:3-dehydroquinate synthase
MFQIIELNESRVEIGNLELSSFATVVSQDFASAKKVIIVDENTHDCCLEYLLTTFPSLESAEVMLLPTGEENKVMEVCFQVWEALTEYGINRTDLIINLGGGVVTDMGGFIASVFKRGVTFIHIPTSLMGMVDAAIGGKTGIDLGTFKNQLGTFNLPLATYIDSRFLSTLPEEEWVNGFAEVLKHALITDKTLWNELIKNGFLSDASSEKMHALILKSAAIKASIVCQDPFEKSSRKLLNFGHTVGHAIEGFFLHSEDAFPHGTAIAYGMIAESFISKEKGLLSATELDEIVRVLVAIYPNPGRLTSFAEELYELMLNDKKNDATGIRCVLLNGIGNATFDGNLSKDEFKRALKFLEYVYYGGLN